MKTLEKIEKKGYKVTFNMGYRNGESSVVSVTAKKDGRQFTKPNLTQLLKAI
jgi:hypothetical protein